MQNVPKLLEYGILQSQAVLNTITISQLWMGLGATDVSD